MGIYRLTVSIQCAACYNVSPAIYLPIYQTSSSRAQTHNDSFTRRGQQAALFRCLKPYRQQGRIGADIAGKPNRALEFRLIVGIILHHTRQHVNPTRTRSAPCTNNMPKCYNDTIARKARREQQQRINTQIQAYFNALYPKMRTITIIVSRKRSEKGKIGMIIKILFKTQRKIISKSH